MKILFRPAESLCQNIESVQERIMFYQENVYDNVYIFSNGTYGGFYNLRIDKAGAKPEKDLFFNGMPLIKDVYAEFSKNVATYRIPVVEKGKLVGEFYNYLSVGKSLALEIEEKCFEISKHIKPLLKKWSFGKKIILEGNQERKKEIKKLFDNNSFVNSKNVKDVIYLDVDFFCEFRKYARKDAERYISLSNIIVEILVTRVFDFFNKNGIFFYAACGVKKSKIKIYFSETEITNSQKTLEGVLQDEAYVEKLYADDPESKAFVKKHKNDLSVHSKIVSNGLSNILVDNYEDGFNIIAGKRLTVGCPQNARKSVHIFGPCIVQGLCVVDSKTMPSILQRLINEKEPDVRVVNHGVAYGRDLINDLLSMMETDFKQGDIVIWLNCFNDSEIEIIKNLSIKTIDCESQFVDQHDWFCNIPFHCTAKANNIIAESVFKSIEGDLKRISGSIIHNMIKEENLGLGYNLKNRISPYEINLYKEYLIKNKRNLPQNYKIGSIMISANPCTNGHMYLIKESLKRVDFLYVFLVVANTKGFDYLDREKILKENLEVFENVCVLSGGESLTSEKYFPEYFNRDVSLKKIDTSLLMDLFGQHIAPILNVKWRFFGDEENDYVTSEYNRSALEILPKYGIKVEVFPRLKDMFGKAISAKIVRKLWQEKKYKDLVKFIPLVTYKNLLEMNDDLTQENLDLYI